MHNKPPLKPPLHLGSEADTILLARAFARQLRVGDVLLLNGGLAMGKTYFVNAAAAELGAEGVSSPTYTIANIYPAKAFSLLHVDAYRLRGEADFIDLGLEADLEHGVAFIEWGAALEGVFEHYVSLDFSPDPARETARFVAFSSFGARGGALLKLALQAYREAQP